MKKITTFSTILLAIAATFQLSSCVSKGKFLTSENNVARLRSDSASCHTNLSNCSTAVKLLSDSNALLQSQYAYLQNDLQNATSAMKNSMAQSNMTIAQQAKRLKDLQDLIQSQRNVMNKLRKSIADALVNFKPDELSVYIKDGNVYVSLEEKLLFKSGSAVVNPKGKDALATLALVLIQNPDINVMIEGHTDTVPIKNEKFEDNWALSVGRAASVVRILTRDDEVNPYRVTAAGRGEFHPVATNGTNEGRATNRRTEIILSPDLTDLYKLLGQ